MWSSDWEQNCWGDNFTIICECRKRAYNVVYSSIELGGMPLTDQ